MKSVRALIGLLVFAVSPGLIGYAAAETPTIKQTTAKKKAPAPTAKVQGYSPYSSNPEYDVYVNGQYIGSDPDPRIRWSLKKEWIGRFRWD